MVLRIRGYHMHVFTDFSDGALFGSEVRFFLIERYTTGYMVLSKRVFYVLHWILYFLPEGRGESVPSMRRGGREADNVLHDEDAYIYSST